MYNLLLANYLFIIFAEDRLHSAKQSSKLVAFALDLHYLCRR